MMKLPVNFQIHLFIYMFTKTLPYLSNIQNEKDDFLYVLPLVLWI